MTTDISAEDRTITDLPLVRGRITTTTDAGEDAIVGGAQDQAGESTSEVNDAWDVIDSVPSRCSPAGMAAYEFAKRVGAMPTVTAVTHAFDRGVNLIWTFILKRDKTTRRQIYAEERALMAQYPDLTFNFHVGSLDQGASSSAMRDLEGRIVMWRPPELQ